MPAQPTTQEEQELHDRQAMIFHPYNVMLVLVLFSITALFLSFSVAYIYTRVQNGGDPVKLPWLFLFNTLILLGSSYTMHLAIKAYKADQTEAYQKTLQATLILSVLFLFSQMVAWYQLFSNNVFIHSSNASGYLYVISGLHFLHVIGGIPFLAVFLYQAKKYMVEPVSVLIYFSDPDRRLRLRLITLYWHFLDALWIYLVIFFFVNYWIR